MNREDQDPIVGRADLDWLAAQEPRASEPSDATTARARTMLLERCEAESKRFNDPSRHSREARWRGRPVRVLAVAATCAAAFAVFAIAGGGGESDLIPAGPEVAEAAPLLLLADRVDSAAEPRGDATLIERHHSFPDDQPFSGYDLYTDDGRYFYGATLDGLRAAVEDGVEGDAYSSRVVEAAKAAADLSPEEGRRVMFESLYGSHPFEKGLSQDQEDNRVWIVTLDALNLGAGDTDVRAGVMRVLSTIETVQVEEKTNRRGKDVLLVTSSTETSNSALGPTYEERLTLDAISGIPLGFEGGEPGLQPSVTVDYEIERIDADKEFPGI